MDVPCCFSVSPTPFSPPLFICLSICHSICICIFSLAHLKMQRSSHACTSLSVPVGAFYSHPLTRCRDCVSRSSCSSSRLCSFLQEKTNVGDPLTDLLPAVRPAEPGSRKFKIASISNSLPPFLSIFIALAVISTCDLHFNSLFHLRIYLTLLQSFLWYVFCQITM